MQVDPVEFPIRVLARKSCWNRSWTDDWQWNLLPVNWSHLLHLLSSSDPLNNFEKIWGIQNNSANRGLGNNAGDNTIQNSIGFFHACELKQLVILQSRIQIYLHQPYCLLSFSSCFYTVAKKLPHTLTRDKHLTHFFWMINTLWYAHLDIRLRLDDLGVNRIHQHNSTNFTDKNNHPWKENRLHRLQLAKTTFCAPWWFACIVLQIMTAEPKTSLNFKATIESFCQWWRSNNQLHSLDIPISAYVSYTLCTLHMLFGAT